MSLPHTTNRLPQVLTQSAPDAASLHLQLLISADLACFAGHFPSIAIVPGVAQVDWVVRLAGLVVADLSQLAIKKLKFQHPLIPEHKVNLSIAFDRPKSALRFSFHDERREYSSGEIHFG